MATPNEPIKKQMSTLEMLEYCEKKPHEVVHQSHNCGIRGF